MSHGEATALIADVSPSPLLSLSGNYTRLVLQFELRRNVLYFILETYVPSTFLVVLSWVSFWISLDSVPARTCIGEQLQPEVSKSWVARSCPASFSPATAYIDSHKAGPGVGFLRGIERKRERLL